MQIAISFAVGVLSSLVAAGLVYLRHRARYRLRFHAVLRLIGNLGESIRQDGYAFDYVVAIGRNSGVAGSILAGQFGLTAVISVSATKERQPDGTRSIALEPVSRAMLPTLAGRRLLVFICCNDSGVSLQYVVGELLALDEPPLEVRTAALYTSPSPAFMPQYRAVVLEKEARQSMTQILTGLPWVTPRWLHPFGKERQAA